MQKTSLKLHQKTLISEQSVFTLTNLSVIVPNMNSAPPSIKAAPQTNETDLVVLLKAIETKNRHAFECFYDLTVTKIYHYAQRITQQHELAEEVVSDVYMRVWQQTSSYQSSRGSVIAWLTIMCRSRALDALRRTASATQLPPLVDTNINVDNPARPQDLLLAVEKNSALHAALSQSRGTPTSVISIGVFSWLHASRIG